MNFATIHHVCGRQLVAHIWPTGEGPWTFNLAAVRQDGQFITWTELYPTRDAAVDRLEGFDRSKAVAAMTHMLERETQIDIATACVRGEGKALQ